MRPDRAPSPFAGKRTQVATAATVPEPAFARTFEADALAVRGVLRAAVSRFARRIGQDDSGVLELALAEVLNNVVEHGYNGEPAGLVRVVIGRTAGGLQCRVEDAGSPVPDDVLLVPEDEVERFDDLLDVPEGGYGWKLIHSLVTDVRYSQVDGYNRMTFRIPLASGAGTLPNSCRNESQSKPESDGTTGA